MNNNYDDIINLEHHISKKHPQMSIEARTAQFAPFSALATYEDNIKETERLTDKRIEIDEGLKNILNKKLQFIDKNINLKPKVKFIYFTPDLKKDGGKYIEKNEIVKKIDKVNQQVILIDKTKIPMIDIIDITSNIFYNK